MKFAYAIMLLFCLGWPFPAHAVQPDEMLSDPKLETRARALSKELRCMVCQNESIDESEAPLAHDIRVLVRERIAAGDSDQQVISFLVSRYGEFVLLKPRLSWHTAMLWGLPPGLLLVGTVLLLISAKRRNRQLQSNEIKPLSTAEEARISELLRSENQS